MDEQCHKCYLQVVLIGLKMHQNLKQFQENYNPDSNGGYFLEL